MVLQLVKVCTYIRRRKSSSNLCTYVRTYMSIISYTYVCMYVRMYALVKRFLVISVTMMTFKEIVIVSSTCL